jgi:hypothetical protein
MAGAALARTVALLIATATSALAGEPSNPACRADIHRAGNLDLRQTGPLVRGEAAAPQFYLMGPESFEWALVQDCQIALAPQFEWQFGTGARRSDGITSFFSANEAMGANRNSARDVREQLISR